MKKKKLMPDCAITCEQQNCIQQENDGEAILDCSICRDRNKCLNES